MSLILCSPVRPGLSHLLAVSSHSLLIYLAFLCSQEDGLCLFSCCRLSRRYVGGSSGSPVLSIEGCAIGLNAGAANKAASSCKYIRNLPLLVIARLFPTEFLRLQTTSRWTGWHGHSRSSRKQLATGCLLRVSLRRMPSRGVASKLCSSTCRLTSAGGSG